MTPTDMTHYGPLYLKWLFRDAELVELCRIANGIESAWFDNPAAFLDQARAWSGSGNLFNTLHRINRTALADHLGATPKGKRTPDAAIQRYTRLFFDFDAVRPKGTSSTDAELAEAECRALALAERLGLMGWPRPAVGMSGNGFHLLFRVALPNNAETADLLRAIYTGLHKEFSDGAVEFDRAVRNPARLCALYGSRKRKGIDHPVRPHRQTFCWIPSDWQQVHPRQVEALANLYARRPANDGVTNTPRSPQEARSAVFGGGAGDYRTLDVIAWFAAHDAYVGPVGAGIHGVRCPWSSQHTTPSARNGSDTVIFEPSGDRWGAFFCHHGHCSGRSIKDVMALWGDADRFCSTTFQPRRMAS